jgi:hypothetical protein
VRDIRRALRIEDASEHVRDVGEGDDAMVASQHPLGRIEVYPAIGGERNRVHFITGELPGNDIAVVLELREQDAVAALLCHALGDEVDRLGRVAGEHKALGPSADQPRGG